MVKKRKNGLSKTAEQAIEQTELLLLLNEDERLDVPTLETWLWDAACAIRGATDAPKFKALYPTVGLLQATLDVFDDEFAKHVEQFGDEEVAHDIVKADHEDALKTGRKPIVRFYIPHDYSWKAIRNHGADGHLGEFVYSAMREVARLNPDLQGVIDRRGIQTVSALDWRTGR